MIHNEILSERSATKGVNSLTRFCVWVGELCFPASTGHTSVCNKNVL
jgi:hypothetical protein